MAKKRIKSYKEDRVIPKGAKVTLRLLISLGVLMGLGIGIFGGMKFWEYVQETPPLDTDKLIVSQPSVIKDIYGETVAKLGVEERQIISIEDIPQEYKDALISTEDRRFYQHQGFDLIRITRSALGSVIGGLGSSGGGSTLTQQLVKLSFLDPNDFTLKRKAQEAYLSYTLESQYTKDEILEMYINKVYMGNGIYGVGTASKYYYGKDLKDLTIPQLSFLAGAMNEPESLNPYTNEEYTQKRRDTVLYSMLDNEKITEKEYNEYVKVSIKEGLKDEKDLSTGLAINKEYYSFVDSIVKEAKEIVGEEALYNDGLIINTTLDKEKQKYVNKLVQTNDIMNHPNENIIYSISVMDSTTGRVVAEGAGNTGKLNKYTLGGFNYVTDMQQQAGSTMKPILAYAPAIEYLGYNTGTLIEDSEYTFSDGNKLYNYDFRYMGDISMRKALAGSRNTTAVRTQEAVGRERAYEFANKLGFNYKPEEYLESGVIGGISNANPHLMAQSYAPFSNNGVYNQGHYITSIQDKDGSSYYIEKDGEQVMSSGTAYMTADMLKSAVEEPYGVSSYIKANGIYIAGKTGTTNYSDEEFAKYGFWNGEVPDTWAIGTNSKYTIAVWVGYENRKQGVTSAQRDICQYIVSNLFTQFMDEGDNGEIIQPEDVYFKKGEIFKD